MNDLLQRAIAADGGLAHFQEFQTVSADVSIGGALWALNGRPPRTNVQMTVDLRRERVEFTPFGGPSQRGVFTPHHLTVETAEGSIVAERADPRAAFAGDTRETPWDDLDQLYFPRYAIWTYLTVPFSLSWSGFEVTEIEPWQEDNQTWRRLSVTFPPHIASHSTQQVFYFDAAGQLRRHDYQVEIVGNSPAAHYVSDYVEVVGLFVARRRCVFPRQPDNTPAPNPVTIAIDLDRIQFE